MMADKNICITGSDGEKFTKLKKTSVCNALFIDFPGIISRKNNLDYTIRLSYFQYLVTELNNE